MKKILLLMTFMLALCMQISFADSDANNRGGYVMTLYVNEHHYSFQDYEFVYDYEGLYFSPALYKRAFNLDITRTGDTWVISKDSKELGRFKSTDTFKLYEDDEDEIERYIEADDHTPFLLMEGIFDILGDDFTYNWELISDPETDTFELKQIHTFVPTAYQNNANLEPINPVIYVDSVDKLKSLNKYIKKMSKNVPKINKSNNTVTYNDASCSVIISLNEDKDITISHTGKLTQTAYDLIGMAYVDALDKSASKKAVAELKRLNDIMTTKSKAAKLKELENRDFIKWYYFGEDGLFKWSYEISTVQGKKYLDFTITNCFMNTTNYYE